MPMSMGSNKRPQQPVCCRPGCGKRPTRSIPSSLFCGRRTKVCKACYTWMRRHFQVEPNGKHVRCTEAGILDRCAAMLEAFGKAGVYPSAPARRNPKLVLPASNRFSYEASCRHGDHAGVQHHHEKPSVAPPAPPTRHPHHAAAPPAAPMHRVNDGLARQFPGPTPGVKRPAPATEWVDVEFAGLSDTETDCGDPELTPESEHGSEQDVDLDSDCDMGASQAAPSVWDAASEDTCPSSAVGHALDLDTLSTSSINAWRDLVDDGAQSVDWDFEIATYDWQPAGVVAGLPGVPEMDTLASMMLDDRSCTSPMLPSPAPCAQAPQGVALGLGYGNGNGNGAAYNTSRARSVTPIRCPLGGQPPKRRACGSGQLQHQHQQPVSPWLLASPSASYAQDVRMAACGSRTMKVDRALTPPRMPHRVASTESLFSCGGMSTLSNDTNAALYGLYGLPPKHAAFSLDVELAAAGGSMPRRKYGRRAASVGVGHAVAALARGDASPVDVHVSG